MNPILNDLKTLYGNKPHRLNHVLGVRDTAIKLGKQYGCNLDWLEQAALLHDITKYEPYEFHVQLIQKHYTNADEIIAEYNPKILHAFSAAVVAQETYGVINEVILDAIRHHTIGRPNMTIYEEIIFLSDYIEPNRTYESCVKVRALAETSLVQAIYVAIDDSITFHEQEHAIIPRTAYLARDYYKHKLEEQE